MGTVPTVVVPTVTVPVGLTVTGTLTGVDTTPPKVIVVGAFTVAPAGCPAVAMLIVQGFTVIVCPTAKGDGATKVLTVIAKMHDPNVVLAVKLPPPTVKVDVGVADDVFENTTVKLWPASAGDRAAPPPGKENVWFATAGSTVAVTGATTLVDATFTGAVESLLH